MKIPVPMSITVSFFPSKMLVLVPEPIRMPTPVLAQSPVLIHILKLTLNLLLYLPDNNAKSLVARLY